MGGMVAGNMRWRDVSGTLRKQTVTKFNQAPEDRSFTFIASDGSVDRMGDTIAPEGWQLDRFKANPVILFGHDQWSFPVGKALNVGVEDGKLLSKVQFTAEDENPDGFRTMKLVAGGYLRAVSVGFHPIESKIAADRDDGQAWIPPYDFTKQELLEISVVPVPANPNALVQARAAGLEVEFVATWAERVLEETRGAGLWIPRERREKTIHALTPAKVIVDLAPSAPAPAPAAAPVVKEAPAPVMVAAPAAPPAPTLADLVKEVIAEERARFRAMRTGKL